MAFALVPVSKEGGFAGISPTGGIRQCGIMQRSPTHCTGWRSIPDAVALQVLDGDYELRLESRRSVIVKHREGVLIPPGLRHELRVRGKSSIVSQWCHFNLEGWGGICVFDLLSLPMHLSVSEAAIVGSTVRTVVHCRQRWQENTLKWHLREQAQFFKMAESFFSKSRSEVDFFRMTKFQPFLPVLRLMKERLSNPPDRTEVAAMMGLSESHFHTRFREIFNQAPMDYLLGLRLRRAKELLFHTGLSIKEISEKCGFDSASYFCRLFRTKAGASPARYREEFLRMQEDIVQK